MNERVLLSTYQIPRLVADRSARLQSEFSRLATERHYKPEELGEMWGLSHDTIFRLFEHEPGVLVIDNARGGGYRRHRTLRIPESVAMRVHRRLSNV